MPLLKYFATVGAALFVVLLVINAVMEPARPPLLPPAAATRAIAVPKPRVTTGATTDTRPLPVLHAVGTESGSLQATTSSIAPSPQLSPAPTQAPAPVAATRRKKRATTGRATVEVPARAGRTYEPSPYASQARQRTAPDYGAEGTLGPH